MECISGINTFYWHQEQLYVFETEGRVLTMYIVEMKRGLFRGIGCTTLREGLQQTSPCIELEGRASCGWTWGVNAWLAARGRGHLFSFCPLKQPESPAPGGHRAPSFSGACLPAPLSESNLFLTFAFRAAFCLSPQPRPFGLNSQAPPCLAPPLGAWMGREGLDLCKQYLLAPVSL